MKQTPLEKAISILGNHSQLAKKIGITPWAVSKWDINRPPKDRCLAIEAATDFLSRLCGGEEAFSRQS